MEVSQKHACRQGASELIRKGVYCIHTWPQIGQKFKERDIFADNI